jgi:uncharacterized protein
MSDPGRGPAARDTALAVAGAEFVADPAGALYWPDQRLLAVSDLHLEKGSSFASRGVLLPPYDSAATLSRLSHLIARYAPRLLIALGDNFHDGGGPARLADTDRATLRGLQRRRDWIWITGNHDPDPAAGVGGRFVEALSYGGAGGAARARREPAMLCWRRQAAGDAGVRRLCGRTQRAQWSVR